MSENISWLPMGATDVQRSLYDAWWDVKDGLNAIGCHPEHWDILVRSEAYDKWYDSERLLSMLSDRLDGKQITFMGHPVVLSGEYHRPRAVFSSKI